LKRGRIALSRRDFRLEEEDDADLALRGPPVSRGKRKKRYRFGIPLDGPWTLSGARPKRSPEALLYFFPFSSFSFFCFLYSFLTFAFWLQFDSNQFVNFSKIQNNTVRQ
jgi:hypothetical protein